MPSDLTIAVAQRADATVIDIGGELDMSTCGQLRDAIQSHIGAATGIVLDLAAVSFVDSSAIRVMIEARAAALAAGGSLTIRNPSAPVHRVLTVAGVLDLFTDPDATT